MARERTSTATEPRIFLTMEAESSSKRSSRERTAGSFVDSEICDPRWRAAGFFVDRV